MSIAFAHTGEGAEGLQGMSLLSEWTFDPVFILPLLLAVLYLRGWYRTLRSGDGFPAWRPCFFMAGLLVMALALLSPIDHLAGYSFIWHMVQHELLTLVSVPLILLGAPFIPIVRGLPLAVRKWGFIPLAKNPLVRGFFLYVTRPVVAFAIFIAVVLGWHIPGLYDAALRIAWVHYLEHAGFVIGAGLFWWNIVTPYPFPSRLNYLLRIGIVFASAIPNGGVGATLTFSSEVLYAYNSLEGFWGMSMLEDQQLGGVLMWTIGILVRLFAATMLFIAYAYQEESKEPRFAARGKER